MKNQSDFPMFSFLSGSIKSFIESILYRIIGVERNAKK